MKRYESWRESLERLTETQLGDQLLSSLVHEFNAYKLFVELEIVFDSEDDFLYRQKGQLKLDNSIIEEFLPELVNKKLIPEIGDVPLVVGPTNTFSSVYFSATLENRTKGGGLNIRTKDQDFAIARPIYVKSSFDQHFRESEDKQTHLGFVVAECKTNLDKTMFQEATATAHDVKTSIPGAKYFLLCEWLDMTPVSSAPTDIDEVIILRRAKRISSNRRSAFSTYEGRMRSRDWYEHTLKSNPISEEMVRRFIEHIRTMVSNQIVLEDDVLSKGYF